MPIKRDAGIARHASSSAPGARSIVNVGYRSTNFWVVSAGRSRFLVDLGWPGMFGALEAKWMKPGMHYTEITPGDNTVIPLAEGRALLRTLGIDGELLRSKGAKQVYAGHGPIRGMP